jgi:hypothetical protein
MINKESELDTYGAVALRQESAMTPGAVKGVVAMLVGVSIAATGCTHVAAKRNKVNEALAEESRALTTAVVDSLQAQPASERDPYSVTALAFAKQDQRVEGLPLRPFDVPALLAGMGLTNNLPPLAGPPAVEAAREEVAERFEKQDELIGKRAAAEERLIERGTEAEEARNRRITRWTKFGIWGTTLIGGAVALFVFCPIALPICGRLLAWLVGKVPSLASAFGVVSVKAFDAVLRGIEKAKDEHAKLELGDPGTARLQPGANNSPAAPTVSVANALLAGSSGDSRRGQTTSWIDQLHNHLSREMDAAHKALVRSRKIQLA